MQPPIFKATTPRRQPVLTYLAEDDGLRPPPPAAAYSLPSVDVRVSVPMGAGPAPGRHPPVHAALAPPLFDDCADECADDECAGEGGLYVNELGFTRDEWEGPSEYRSDDGGDGGGEDAYRNDYGYTRDEWEGPDAVSDAGSFDDYEGYFSGDAAG